MAGHISENSSETLRGSAGATTYNEYELSMMKKKEEGGSPHDSQAIVSMEDVKEKDQDPFAHLPPHEAAVLKRQVFVPEVAVGIKTLYRFATTWDLIIIFISCVCAIIAGAALPLMTVR